MAAFLVAALLAGCSALAQKQIDGVGYPFDAISEYPKLVECAKGMGVLGLFYVPYIAIDFPFTLLAEVVLLPFDLAFRKSEPKANTPCK
jgi:uncharacterized protein YceK